MLFTRGQMNNNFKQMGLVFKMFANEARGTLSPPMHPTEGAFYPKAQKIYPEYMTDPKTTISVFGVGTAKAAYFGYVLDSEEVALSLLDAYEELGPEALYDSDLDVGAGLGTGGGDIIYRLSENLGDTMDAQGIAAPMQSEIPILWELPGTREEGGGWVLYMDGHTQWKTYPGDFPMTETFVQRILQLRQDPTDIPKALMEP